MDTVVRKVADMKVFSHLARQNVHLVLARLEQGVDDETAEVAQAARNSDDRHGGGKKDGESLTRADTDWRERERVRERETKSERKRETQKEKANRRWCSAETIRPDPKQQIANET